MNKPVCNSLSVEDVADDTPKLWLDKQAKEHRLKYLLAHAEDGVIWGHFKDGELVTSGDVFSQCAKLRSPTLQQCRIFGEKAEVMLWKVGQNWKARLVKDDNQPECLPDEYQILSETQVEKESNGFTLVSDSSQGLRHAIPLFEITNKFKDGKRPLRLAVRHYIDYDDAGIARIYLSRLVDLTTKLGD